MDETTYYSFKYGRVVIFTGDNYVQFATSCRFALTDCGAWPIVQETEQAPAEGNTAAIVATPKEYQEKLNRGIQIISSSVREAFIN